MPRYRVDADIVRNNIWNFYLPIEMPGVWFFNHAITLKRIDLYYNGKFEKGEFDSQNFKKYFYNIVQPSCDIASKFLNLETKDVILLPDHTDDEQSLWLMRQDLREWMRENGFGKVMDEVIDDFPKYGSVVLKKDKTKNWRKVNLVNLRFDIATDTLENSAYVYEIILMAPHQIDEMVKAAGWDKQAVDDLYNRGKRQTKYFIYETYDINTGEGKKWKRKINADLFTYNGGNNTLMRTAEVQINRPQDYIPALTLYEDEVDELPYREVHLKRIPGRWLGFGLVEYLFDNQIRRNELINVKAKKLYTTSLTLLQTKDQTVASNILTEMENGDVIRTTDELTPVDMQERNLAYFDNEMHDWDQNKVDKTFTTDVSKGENLPSRTPLGVANLQMGMVTTFFEKKRKLLGFFFRDLIVNDIIPRFNEEVAPKHKLMFAGSEVEMEKMIDSIARAHVSNAAMDHLTKTGFMPTQQEFDSEVQRIKQGLMRHRGLNFTIPESYYKNAKYKVDILTTGEQIDTASTRQTLQTVMQIIGTNPAVMQDPAMRAILFMMMELSGVDPVEIDMMKQQVQQQQQQQQQNGQPQQQLPTGGSIVVPKGISNPAFVPKRQVL